MHQQRTQATTRRDRSTAGRPTTNATVAKDGGERAGERLATTGQDDPSPARAKRTAATSHRRATDRWKKWARTPLSTARARTVGPSSRPHDAGPRRSQQPKPRSHDARRKNSNRATRETESRTTQPGRTSATPSATTARRPKGGAKRTTQAVRTSGEAPHKRRKEESRQPRQQAAGGRPNDLRQAHIRWSTPNDTTLGQNELAPWASGGSPPRKGMERGEGAKHRTRWARGELNPHVLTDTRT